MEYTQKTYTTHETQHATMHSEHGVKQNNMFQPFWKKKFALFLTVLVVFIAGMVLYRQLWLLKPHVKMITVNKQILQKRSKSLGYVNRGLTGSAIDVSTGKIVKATRIFSADDKTVYLELDFNSAVPKGLVVDYIRYKDGKYVDHREVTLVQANTKNLLFSWIISNLLSNIRNGKWRVAMYTNGVLAERISYEITNNKVSYVYPSTPVSPSDPDYLLSIALAQNH